MGSGLTIRAIRLSTGDYYPVLLDSGLPFVLPNLWAYDLSQTARFNTVKAYLGDVLQLHRWAEDSGTCLYREFESLRPLPPRQLRSLAAYMTTRRDGRRAAQSSCDRKFAAISSYFTYAYEHFAAKASLGLLEQRQAEKNKEATVARLSTLFKMLSQQSELPVRASEISKEKICALDGLARPASVNNPFVDQAVQVRNYCILHVMLETAARRAEVVLLEVDDVCLGPNPTLRIKRPTPFEQAKRKDGASLKTQPRLLPISRHLAALLEGFLEDWRDSLLKPRRPTKALFPSSRDGRRLSVGAINSLLKKINSCDTSGLVGRVHPHGIRTTSLNDLSRKDRDESGRSSGAFRDSLTYFAGWSPGSEMPLRYLRESLTDSLNRLMRKSGGGGS